MRIAVLNHAKYSYIITLSSSLVNISVEKIISDVAVLNPGRLADQPARHGRNGVFWPGAAPWQARRRPIAGQNSIQAELGETYPHPHRKAVYSFTIQNDDYYDVAAGTVSVKFLDSTVIV
jgi:hypothetical protein